MIPKQEFPKIAAKRGAQTLAEGAAVVVIMATITAIGSSLSAGSWSEWFTSWPLWTWAAFQAAGTAAVAYVVRRFADHTGVEGTE